MINTLNSYKTGANYLVPYFAFWLTIGMTFEAVYLLSPNVDDFNAVKMGIKIIGPATLLGLVVLQFALRSPMPQEKLVLWLSIHGIGAFLYSVLWVVSIVSLSGLEKLISSGVFSFDVPAIFILRWHVLAGTIMYTTIVSTVVAVRSFERTQSLLREAELQVMRAQLNPHFLFNTLHTIMILFRRDTNKAEQAMEQFSDLIRYSFHNDGKYQTQNKNGQVTLEKEWIICKKYLDLERLRLGDKLSLTTEIDNDALRFMSPQLLLQPIIENAIIHGVANNENGGNIDIKIKNENNIIHIWIKNSVLNPTDTIAKETSGLGLLAVKASLESTFDANAVLKTEILEDVFFQASITMPAEELSL